MLMRGEDCGRVRREDNFRARKVASGDDEPKRQRIDCIIECRALIDEVAWAVLMFALLVL